MTLDDLDNYVIPTGKYKGKPFCKVNLLKLDNLLGKIEDQLKTGYNDSLLEELYTNLRNYLAIPAISHELDILLEEKEDMEWY